MNIQDIPTPSDVVSNTWNGDPLGSQTHKSWLLSGSLRAIIAFFSRDEVCHDIKTKMNDEFFFGFPMPVPVRYDSKEYDLSFIIDDLKTIMALRGWSIALSAPLDRNGDAMPTTVYMWPSHIKLSGKWYDNVMTNAIPHKHAASVEV